MEHQLKTAKTGRVFIEGDIQSANLVFIALHGYAQLATTFIQEFAPIVQPGIAVIAPEGLHRFYRKGFYGDVVASWMTKEDRLNDIKDYCGFLDQVYAKFIQPNQHVVLVGFSQGVATACRWMSASKPRINQLVFWSGSIPTDLPIEHLDALHNCQSFMVYDDKDVFRTAESVAKQEKFLKAAELQVTEWKMHDGHALKAETFNRFVETYITPSLSN